MLLVHFSVSVFDSVGILNSLSLCNIGQLMHYKVVMQRAQTAIASIVHPRNSTANMHRVSVDNHGKDWMGNEGHGFKNMTETYQSLRQE